jgi:hypothetical protein
MNYSEIYREIVGGATSGALHSWTEAVLTEIAEGRRQLRAVRHPLGFLCLPVIRAGDDGVCVHVWLADRPPVEATTSPMHSHSWDLLSYVLYGEIHNETLTVEDDPDRPTHRIYEVRSHDDVDEIHATARLVRPATGAVDVHRPGGAYTLRAGHFHVTDVLPGQAAATVALGRMRRGAHDLSLGPVTGHTHVVRRQHCTPGETTTAAQTVTAHLSVPAS